MSTSISTASPTEQVLELPNGRQIAYVSTGNPNGHVLIIFYHGMFGVGRAARLAPAMTEIGSHFLAPTLPGWGNTSPPSAGLSFAHSVLEDTKALIDHLYPTDPTDGTRSLQRIYVGGGSFGTVPAQIVYGAPYNVFPHGRMIHGLLLLAAFSPFRLHEGYAKTLPWETYISIGPPAYHAPFQILQRLMQLMFRRKLATPEGGEAFVRQFMFDNMSAQEKEAYRLWREQDPDRRGTEPGILEREFGEMVHASVARSWRGYFDVVPAVHSDWLFDPRDFPADHHGTTRGKVVVYGGSDDWRVPQGMAQWIVQNYPGGEYKELNGGHLSAIWGMDGIWSYFLKEELQHSTST